MDLTGHHSNPSTHLNALLDGIVGALNDLERDVRQPERRSIKEPGSATGKRHRRHDWVQQAVITVLERRGEPMQARDVHAAAEALLGEPVRWGSVKACLALTWPARRLGLHVLRLGATPWVSCPPPRALHDESRRKEAVRHHARSSSQADVCGSLPTRSESSVRRARVAAASALLQERELSRSPPLGAWDTMGTRQMVVAAQLASATL